MPLRSSPSTRNRNAVVATQTPPPDSEALAHGRARAVPVLEALAALARWLSLHAKES